MLTWQEVISEQRFKEASEGERKRVRDAFWEQVASRHPDAEGRKDYFYKQTEPDVFKTDIPSSILLGILEGSGVGPIARMGEKIPQPSLPSISEEEALLSGVPIESLKTPLVTREQFIDELAATRRQHPLPMLGGEVAGMVAGPGKVIAGATKGMKALPGLLTRAGAWGGFGAGREAEEQLQEEGKITKPGKIALEGGIWAAMEPVGELGLRGIPKIARAIKKKIPAPKTRQQVLEEEFNVYGISKNVKVKTRIEETPEVIYGGKTRPAIEEVRIEITNPAGEIKKFADVDLAKQYIDALPLASEGKAVIRDGVKGTIEAKPPATAEEAIQQELLAMKKLFTGKGGQHYRNIVRAIERGEGKQFEKAREIAHSRIVKRQAGLDATGMEAAAHEKPISNKYVKEPPDNVFAPDPVPPANVSVGAWGGKTMPIKKFFDKLANKANNPRIYQSWRSMQDGYRDMVKFETRLRQEAREILGPLQNNMDSRKTITWLLENNKEMLASRVPSPSEIETASKLRKLYDELFEIMELPKEKYLVQYAPHFRRLKTFDLAGVEPRLRKSIQWLNELEREGGLVAYEEDALIAFDRYVRGAAKKKYLKEGYDYLMQVKKGLPRAERELVENYLETMYGYGPLRGYTARTIVGVMKKAGATEDEARQIATLLSRQLYAGGLGLRPFPIIRNFTQQSLAMPVMGTKYWAEGAKKALSATERARVKGFGILPETYQPIGIGEELVAAITDMGKKMRWPQKTIEYYQKLLDISLWAYRKSDFVNREVVFLGYEKKILDLAKQLTKGGKKPAWAEFSKKANFRFFDKAVIETELKPAFSEGLVRGDFSKLAERAGKNLVEDTQWIYSRGASPELTRRHPMLFQFGTWPLNAIHYIPKLTRLGPKAWAKIAAFWGGISIAGSQLFGVDIRSWNPMYSLLYKGGPVASTAIGLTGAISSTAYGGSMAPMAWKELQNNLWIWFPCGLQAKSIVQAVEKEEPVKRVLGLRSVKKKEKAIFKGTRRGRPSKRGRRFQ